nr:MAG TPA: hypothetical protein [Caudoviricetes sp.]
MKCCGVSYNGGLPDSNRIMSLSATFPVGNPHR